MAENTKIQWCDHTFNPWLGCAKVSEGCQNCYAENLMDTRYHRVEWGTEGTRQRTKTWRDPLKWDRQAAAAGEKRKVFCASLADVFEDFRNRAGGYPLDVWRQDLFDLIDNCQNLYWLLLTKRPENIGRMWGERKYITPDERDANRESYLSYGERENVWLGTSISNQRNAEECVDKLLESRSLAPVLFLSLEPQIGFVDLRPWLYPEPLVNWVIVGGESQQSGQARPFQMEWAFDMVDQCREANVPVFVKQMGSNVWHRKRQIILADGHGGDMNQWPESLRVRECPEVFYANPSNQLVGA